MGLPVEDDALAPLTVVASDLRTVTVPALMLPVPEALPVLTRARAAADSSGSADFWGAASLLALQLAARGLLLPGLSPTGMDAWRIGPLAPEDLERMRTLAASMPPAAHAVPVDGPAGTLRLPEPECLLRQFLDAVADGLPRSPAAPLAVQGPAFAAPEPQHLPGLRAWAADIAAGHDAGVRLSLRVELPGLEDAGPADDAPRFRAVLQIHSVSDPALVADAADVWAGSGSSAAAFGPRARLDALLALRRAAHAWPSLAPLLHAAVPDAVDLADEEVTELLGEASRALAATGVQVHWPRQLARRLTARAVIGPPDDGDQASGQESSGLPSFLSADALLSFNWRFALGDDRLTRDELDQLAQAGRPVVRLRDEWVLIDPAEARRARESQDHKLSPVDALGAVLTGTAEVDGRTVEVEASGALERLRERLAEPEGGPQEIGQPAALRASLRDYQLRGLNWLHRMTSLGLGGCLADDMGSARPSRSSRSICTGGPTPRPPVRPSWSARRP
jgi:hypothetical protein